jgi:multidrug transporter EmrE-like cation transporter
MSLRAFHIVFVTACTLLSLFLAVWAFGFATDRTEVITALGVVGAIGTVVMPVYGVYFYRKARKILL